MLTGWEPLNYTTLNYVNGLFHNLVWLQWVFITLHGYTCTSYCLSDLSLFSATDIHSSLPVSPLGLCYVFTLPSRGAYGNFFFFKSMILIVFLLFFFSVSQKHSSTLTFAFWLSFPSSLNLTHMVSSTHTSRHNFYYWSFPIPWLFMEITLWLGIFPSLTPQDPKEEKNTHQQQHTFM